MSEEEQLFTVEDAVGMARDAMQRAQEAEEQADELSDSYHEALDEIEQLRFRLTEVEATLPDENSDYEALEREDKISLIQNHVIKRARSSPQNWAKVTWFDVKWSVFDGEPSDGHCYDLVRWAADETGFNNVRPDEAGEREYVSVDLDVLHESSTRSRVNNEAQEGRI